MAAPASYEKEHLITLPQESSPQRTPNSESHPLSQSSCTPPRPPSPSKTTNKLRHPRVRRNRPRTFFNIRNTDRLLSFLLITVVWITWLIMLPWISPSVNWSPVLAFFFLPLWVFTGTHVWRNYRRYRVSRAIADDEAVIGPLDADETLEVGLDLYAVGYKDEEGRGLGKSEGQIWIIKDSTT